MTAPATAVPGTQEFPEGKQKRSGRPPVCPLELAVMVVDLWLDGLSPEKISDELNQAGIATPAGRPRWLRSHVDRLLHTRYADELAARLAAQRMAAGMPVRARPGQELRPAAGLQ